MEMFKADKQGRTAEIRVKEIQAANTNRTIVPGLNI